MRYLILFLLLVFPGAASLAAAPVVQPRTLLVLGDSLSAAYRIAPESGWVALLEQRLQSQQPQRRYRVVNASISGETTAGGLARLPKLLADNAPALVLVELGANDGLRGLALDEIRANLQRILKACRDAGAKIVLAGIELPVNYGPQYRDGLRNMYRDIAHEFNVPLVPFLLEGVATDPSLMQDDGMHPLAAAEPRVLDTVWPVLAPVLEKLR
jgi:acyl-CoA thioesterase I